MLWPCLNQIQNPHTHCQTQYHHALVGKMEVVVVHGRVQTKSTVIMMMALLVGPAVATMMLGTNKALPHAVVYAMKKRRLLPRVVMNNNVQAAHSRRGTIKCQKLALTARSKTAKNRI